MDKKVISLGAGLQSTAMLLMMLRDELESADLAIFSDTGWESSATYDNLAKLKVICLGRDFPLHVVHPQFNIRDFHVSGEISHMPLYMKSDKNENGILRRQCTDRFKLRPIKRFLKSQGITRVEMWIGISVDEAARMRDSRVKWITNRYPLVEKRLSSANIRAWFESIDFPTPEKSACLGCPYHSNSYYRKMKRERPVEFSNVVDFDNRIRNQYKKLDGDAFVHSKRQPLSDIDFRDESDLGQLNFLNECEGLCGT